MERWSVPPWIVRPPVPMVPWKRRGRIPWLAVSGKSVSTEPARVVASSSAFSWAGSSSVTAPLTVLTSTLPGSAKPEIAAWTEPFTFFASSGPALVCASISPFTVWTLTGALARATATSPFTFLSQTDCFGATLPVHVHTAAVSPGAPRPASSGAFSPSKLKVKPRRTRPATLLMVRPAMRTTAKRPAPRMMSRRHVIQNRLRSMAPPSVPRALRGSRGPGFQDTLPLCPRLYKLLPTHRGIELGRFHGARHGGRQERAADQRGAVARGHRARYEAPAGADPGVHAEPGGGMAAASSAGEVVLVPGDLEAALAARAGHGARPLLEPGAVAAARAHAVARAELRCQTGRAAWQGHDGPAAGGRGDDLDGGARHGKGLTGR